MKKYTPQARSQYCCVMAWRQARSVRRTDSRPVERTIDASQLWIDQGEGCHPSAATGLFSPAHAFARDNQKAHSEVGQGQAGRAWVTGQLRRAMKPCSGRSCRLPYAVMKPSPRTPRLLYVDVPSMPLVEFSQAVKERRYWQRCFSKVYWHFWTRRDSLAPAAPFLVPTSADLAPKKRRRRR